MNIGRLELIWHQKVPEYYMGEVCEMHEKQLKEQDRTMINIKGRIEKIETSIEHLTKIINKMTK